MKNAKLKAVSMKPIFRRKVSGALGLVAVLGFIFWLYTRADVVILLSEQLWACF